MYKPIIITSGMLIALSAVGGGAAAAKLTDPQIAHIVYTADNLDIDNAKQALDKSKNEGVRRFANRMIGDHTSVNDQALALAKKLNITPEDNPTSKSLKDAQDADRKKRESLSDAAFVDDALSKTLIPDAQNAELKSLLETGLKLFQDHERDAESLAKQLKAAP